MRRRLRRRERRRNRGWTGEGCRPVPRPPGRRSSDEATFYRNVRARQVAPKLLSVGREVLCGLYFVRGWGVWPDARVDYERRAARMVCAEYGGAGVAAGR